MTERHKHADVLIAIAEGMAVQFYQDNLGWIDYEVGYTLSPISSQGQSWKWRVKPEPKPDVVMYGVAFPINGRFAVSGLGNTPIDFDNLKLIFDGETNELKDAEVLK